MKYLAIQSNTNPEMLWSNTDGWTDGDDFDLFTIEESQALNLPIGGQWVRFSDIPRTYSVD